MDPVPRSSTTAGTTSPAITPPVITPPRLARLAVSSLYLLTGIAAGSWSARAPAIQQNLGVGDTAWGAALSTASIAEVVALGVVLFMVHAVAPRRMAVTGAVVVLLVTPLLGRVSTLWQLVGALAGWYFAAQLMAAPMGGMAIEVGRRYGRPLMASFAAVWTIGTAAGAGLSTLAVALEVSVAAQFTATSLLLGVVVGVTARWLPADAPPRRPSSMPSTSVSTSASGRRAGWRGQLLRRWTPRMWLIAVVSFAGAYTASAVGQWSALYVSGLTQHGSQLSPQVLAAVASGAVTAMSIAGGAVLLVADRLRTRMGAVRFVRWSAGCAVVGLVSAVAYPVVGVVVVGLVLLAVGSACVGPTVDGLAGEQPGLRPAEGIAVAEAGQLPGFLLCPLIIGVLAGAVGLRAALLSVIIAASVPALLIGLLSRTPSGGGEGEDDPP